MVHGIGDEQRPIGEECYATGRSERGVLARTVPASLPSTSCKNVGAGGRKGNYFYSVVARVANDGKSFLLDVDDANALGSEKTANVTNFCLHPAFVVANASGYANGSCWECGQLR